ncbi:MAG: histidine kinase [Duncaniella sp.]|nr:histidine kinase [Duncaniella sp.]
MEKQSTEPALHTVPRRTEGMVYTALWLIVAALYMLNVMRGRAADGETVLDITLLWQTAKTLLPYLLLFLANCLILIPRLLLPGRTGAYFALVALSILCVWGWQYHDFEQMRAMMPRPPMPHIPSHQKFAPLPLPLFLDFIYTLLVGGVNLSISLLFRRFEEKLEHETLLKAHAEERLASLRAQINPHFYMNMLNNIHGMIEIDPAEAQAMVMDMSALMRYSLYESRSETITLEREVAFLSNYTGLMRRRYPESRVSISTDFPTQAETAGIQVPPLIFLVFIENAFKHGISYRDSSFVSVAIRIGEAGAVEFDCLNSVHPDAGRQAPAAESGGGIGLRNAAQRLAIMYGGRAELKTTATENSYHVHLTLPHKP